MKQTFAQLPPEKQQTVLRAALAEFGTHDFAAASLDRIVAAAGISKGGLYEYISAKEELYVYCMEQSWASLYAHIQREIDQSSLNLPPDILDRFMAVSRIAIEWYLRNPAMLGLIVRIARLPRNELAEKAQTVFASHFFEVFAGLRTDHLAYPEEQLVDLIQWFLAKTRKDVLLEIEAGQAPDAVRQRHLDEWTFLCSVLRHGIYRSE